MQSHQALRQFLGQANLDTCKRACELMRSGDLPALGALLTANQQAFDECAAPLCPQQLRAPKLHAVLAHPEIQPFIWGGKGVGSQGDGAAQLLCKSEEAMQTVAHLLEDRLAVSCLTLVVPRTQPAASQGSPPAPTSAPTG